MAASRRKAGAAGLLLVLLACAVPALAAEDLFQPETPSRLVERVEAANAALARGDLDRAGRAEDAVEAFRAAAAVRERQDIAEYSIYNALGWALMQAGNYGKAEQALLRALEFEDRNGRETNLRIYNNLGLLYYYMLDTVRARHYLDVAIRRYDSRAARDTLEQVEALDRYQEQRGCDEFEALVAPDQAEIAWIGCQIWKNETGGRIDHLTYWRPANDFASLGIAHFIWYAAGVEGPFTETFPAFLDRLAAADVSLPDWLRESRENPWHSAEEFQAARNSPRMRDLRALMLRTIPHQVRAMAERLDAALPKILEGLTPEQQAHVRRQYERVLRRADGKVSPAGRYALLDYVNFKGEGVNPKERYKGEGWGLRQVLLEMEGTAPEAHEAFADSAMRVLERRVENAPPERREERFLKGWQRRLDSYREQFEAG